MRPNNQNKRSRGRSGGNRNKQGGNPLTRNYESNGQGVKIRGNAAHIVEKYVQLARDAHNASDSVAEQNYLQHAEHYLRIVTAATAQNLARQEAQQAQHIQNQQVQREQHQVQQNVSVDANKPELVGETTAKSEQAIDGANEKPIRKTRTHRPRRQPRPNDDIPKEASEVKVSDKPKESELPAFLTSGEKPDAAE